MYVLQEVRKHDNEYDVLYFAKNQKMALHWSILVNRVSFHFVFNYWTLEQMKGSYKNKSEFTRAVNREMLDWHQPKWPP